MKLVKMLKGSCVSEDAFTVRYLKAGKDYELTDTAAARLIRAGAAEIIFCNVDWAIHKYMGVDLTEPERKGVDLSNAYLRGADLSEGGCQ